MVVNIFIITNQFIMRSCEFFLIFNCSDFVVFACEVRLND